MKAKTGFVKMLIIKPNTKPRPYRQLGALCVAAKVEK